MKSLLAPLLLFASIFTSLAEKPFRTERETFQIDGRPAFVILPKSEQRIANKPVPWVMYAPTFAKSLPSDRDEGWMMKRFLDQGIAIAGVDVGESYGSPTGRATYNKLHAHLIEKYKFDPKASLLARSRGGLMLYCWAVENPQKVRCIAGIYPVCDMRSYPGLAKACGAYGMTADQLKAKLDEHNPIPRLEALAKAKVPLFHIHGDKDKVVPLDANSDALIKRYKELGGPAELLLAPGQWHNMWRGFFECHELTNFVITHATGSPQPIAHWKLDETEGEIAHDSAGGHHGKFVGSTAAKGKVGGGRLFDRPKGEHVAIPYSKDFGLSTFSVSAWVFLTREPTFSGILGTRHGGERTFDMKINDAKVHGDIGTGKKWLTNKVDFYATDTGSNGQGGDLAIERWYHVSFVIDGGKGQHCRLYLDGDLKKTIAFKGKPLLMQPGQEMRIGNSCLTEFMDGIIDDLKIWDVALSTAQVAAEVKAAN